MKNKKIVLIVVGALVISGLSFFGGLKFGQSKTNTNQFQVNGGAFGQGGMMNKGAVGRNRGGAGGGFVMGEVLSKDDKSVTIKLNDGGSKIVFFSTSTKIEKTVDGLSADVAVGKQVQIMGTTNPDGSVNATSIQMRPLLSPVKTN